MKIELKEEQVRGLIAMIDAVNFPGKDVEKVYELKKALASSLEEDTK